MRRVAYLLLLCASCAPSNRPYLARLNDADRTFLRTRPGPVMGVNHLWSGDVAREEQRIDLARQLGVEVAREPGVGLYEIEATDLSTPRRVARLLRAAGIQPIVLVLHDRPHEITLERWRRAFTQLARAFPDESHFQVLNEPNNVAELTPERYAAIFREAAETLPGRLIFGGLGHGQPDGMSAHDWLRQFHAAYTGDYILALHPYDRGYEFVAQALAIVPDREVWLTEDGSANGLLKPGYLRGSYIEYLRRYPRVRLVCWYAFWNRSDPAVNLIDSDGRPNAAGRAFREIAAEVKR